MTLANLLDPAAVKVIGGVSSKKRLFQELGEVFAAAYGLDAAEVAAALQEREALGPTGVGKGVALPHARLDGLDRVVGAFVRLEKPTDFGATDRQPVDLLFTLLAPKVSGVEHLKSLALVSRAMRDTGTCQKLRANSDPAILHMVMTESQASQAA